MAKETFNRYEKKYLIDSAQRLELERELARHMSLDPYHVKETTYRILNLYYDTVDHRLIRHSLQKPKYKEKLRIRAYGVPTLDSYVYVEIKKKVKGIVNKRRTRMTLRDAYTMLQTREAPPHDAIHNEQVIYELLILLQQQALRPTTLLAYDRRAYTGIKESDLRITFDTNFKPGAITTVWKKAIMAHFCFQKVLASWRSRYAMRCRSGSASCSVQGRSIRRRFPSTVSNT